MMTELNEEAEGRQPCPQGKEPYGSEAAKRARSIRVLVVLLVVLLLAAAAGIGYLAWAQTQMDAALEEQTSAEVPETENLVENPIDFASLKERNDDIYAWIYVPNTNVNLPILQSSTDDNLYLDHDEDGNYSIAGALYTQSMNATDFSDPVTVIYGHNMRNGSMFATLHKFEDPDFFEANDTFYVYTPTKILTYRIVSAYQYDNRHILNSFDFSRAEVRESYFTSMADPDSLVKNVRDGVALDESSKIVQLSTCMHGQDQIRYLVTGVLVDEQGTY